MQERIKIKHPGPRGWAGIVKSAFDPSRHELYTEQVDDPVAKAKELGIRGAHLMKPDTLARKIAEAEAD